MDVSREPGFGSAAAAAAAAAADLARVQGKVEAARAVLVRLLQEVVVAESRRGNSQAARLLEANEQLVVTALHNQAQADAAALALAQLAPSTELDPLTQLPNRVLLLDRMTQAIAAARGRGGRLALLALDLNNFRQVNGTLGHAGGDEALKMVAHRLVAAVRVADTVSRHGGDEFLILLAEIDQASDAGLMAIKLATALGLPGRIDDVVLRLSASIGIAIYPDDSEDPGTLLQRADLALVQTQRQHLGGFAYYAAQAAAPAALLPALRDPVVRHEHALQEHERRHAELRQANEQLVLAALDAQALQAAAELAQRRQSEFLALAAQELADPLAPIRVAAAMLGRADSVEPLLPRAQALIETQVQSMARLVAAVNVMSRSGAATWQLERQTLDLVDVVDAAVAACRPQMDLHLQTLTLKLPGVPVFVQGEPVRLAQVLRNLLDNASKYTPDLGRIELALALRGSDAELTVSDNGIGITALALPELFEPFAQDTQALGVNGVGVGLGLSVVRALVEAHGGRVSARSAGSRRGSQFTVTLPLAPLAPRGAAHGPAAGPQ